MDKKNLTVFQKLTQTFGYQGKTKSQPASAPSFQYSKNDILKTDSKEEYEKAMLQAQQSQYISDKWSKLDQSMYNQSVYYEPNRLSSYYDYESMEFYPMLSTAIDVYAEESCTPSEKGEILTIFSDSKRIKNILTDLFENVLDVNTNLQMWARGMPIRENTIIPLLNGQDISIKDLSIKLKTNPTEDVWTYSIQEGTNKFVPGKIIWCDLTRKNSELVRVTLDNGTYIDTTPDHQYMLRDGSYVDAQNLKIGVSLMPYYTKKSNLKKGKIKGYEMVYSPGEKKYQVTHRIVSNECVIDFEVENNSDFKYLTHHKNFNKLDNSPQNLLRLTFADHSILHNEQSKILDKYRNREDVVKKRREGIDKYLRSDKRKKYLHDKMLGIYPEDFKKYNESGLHTSHNKMRSENSLKMWNNDILKKNITEKMTLNISDECYNHIVELIKSTTKYISLIELSIILKNDNNFINLFSKTYRLKKDIKKSINTKTLHNVIIRKCGMNYLDFVGNVNNKLLNCPKYKKCKNISMGKGQYLNHKVLSVEKITETSDVYCMTVVGPNNENDRHNFPVCSIDSEGNYKRNGVFLSNCKYGDDFVYLKINPELGIVGCQQLPNIEIERVEGASSIKTTMNINTRIDGSMPTRELRFAWKNKDMEFQAWEIAHFRLLGDDRKLPYGTSMLDKVRRIWKQLLLAEDAMLIYRTSRAPERRVFKVFVGNMDDKDIEPYVQRIANKFKRDQVVDPRNGNVDMRYNQMAIDQDFFIPVRDASQSSPIETLPGAQNLGEISDIEYLQKNLLGALRIPKAFLGFEDAVGDGKSLALMDIRFARTINRIQKSLVQELNKIALIHLYLLGLEDELNNFTLSLTNPSSQSDLLKIEQWKEKVLLYKDATSDQSQLGILPVSHTWAKRNILGMSDNEIILDLQQQRLERAIGTELMGTPNIIKRSGIFDDVDKKYGIPEEEREQVEAKGADGGAEGGGDMGAGLGDMGGMPPPPPSAGESAPLSESTKKRKILSMLGEEKSFDALFNMEKAQKNIKDIENKINQILND